jgi:hypothetical protein
LYYYYFQFVLFRLTTDEHGTAFAAMFVGASKGSVYRQLLENNMDNQSFVLTNTGLQGLQDNGMETHFHSYQYILSYEKFHCKMIPVWIGKFPLWHISMALPKGSPYQIFMRNKIFQMTEMGQLHQMMSKFKLKPPVCKPQLVKGKPLELNKLSLPFIIAIIGLATSLFILFYEKLTYTTPKNQDYAQKLKMFNSIRNDIHKKTNELKLVVLMLKKDDSWVDEILQVLDSN